MDTDTDSVCFMDNLHIFLDLLFTFRNISSWQSRGLPLSLLC